MAIFIYSSYLIHTAMSHDSKDEVIERITQRRKTTDDSKESNIPKKEIKEIETDDKNYDWETNTLQDPDEEW